MYARVLDEITLAGPEHLDPAYVARYDRKAHFDPADDLAMLRQRGLGTESTLIDFGAGTGTFAFAVATECERVIAVDISPTMVATMRSRAARLELANVECVEAGFLSYEHSGAPVDFVYTRNALHHLPDFWKALALVRIAELLRPEGVLYLRDLVFAFEPTEADSFMSRWLDTGAENTHDGWTREELEAHVREEHSTFNWLLEPMIEAAGFEIQQVDYGDMSVHAAYLCTRPPR